MLTQPSDDMEAGRATEIPSVGYTTVIPGVSRALHRRLKIFDRKEVKYYEKIRHPRGGNSEDYSSDVFSLHRMLLRN